MANRNAHSGTQFSDGLIVGGDFHADGNLYLNDATSGGGPNSEDQGRIYLGTDADFLITTSDGQGVIRQTTASKDMFIQTADNQSIRITDAGANENLATFTDNAGVKLFNDGSLKFQTTSTGASIADKLLIGPATDGVNVSTALDDLGASVSVTTSTVIEGRTYVITTVGSKSDWSQIGGPAAAGVGAIFTTAGTHMAIATVDAGKTGTNTLAQGIDGASATSQIAELTAFPSDCKVREVPQAKLEFAAHSNDDAYIRTIRGSASGVGTKMQFHLLDDLHSALPTLNNSINLTNLNREVFEFTASKSGVRRDFAALTIVPIYNANKTEGCELILAGSSKVTATYFKGTAEKVAALTGLDTDDLDEGNKKFFDTALVNSHLSVTTAAASGGGALGYNDGVFTYTPPGKATAAALGLAKFASADFSVDSNGEVSLKQLANGDISATAGIALSKLASMTQDRILGKITSDGAPTELTAANVRAMLGMPDTAGRGQGYTAGNFADNFGNFRIQADNDKDVGGAGNYGASGIITSNEKVRFIGAGATTIERGSTGVDSITINSTDTNTTYTAAGGVLSTSGKGIYLDGTIFTLTSEIAPTATQTFGNTEGTKIQMVRSNSGNANAGSIGFYFQNLENMRLETAGNLLVDGDVVGFSSTVSDENLKENIQVVDNALDKVCQLNGVTFNWKKDGKAAAGLIAQQLEKVLPSAITERELPLSHNDGEKYKTVEYSQVTSLFIEAIKELKDQNELLRTEIEELKANK